MRIVKFILTLGLTLGLIILANTHHPFGSQLPALGKFFNPFKGFWKNAEKASAYKDQTIDLASLEQSVEVVFDDRMVPHIFASSNEDAFQALGYLHAKFRLFQMDISSRSAMGKIAEVLGPNALNYDKNRRRIGLGYGVEKNLEAFRTSEKDMNALEAYVKGVNSYLEQLAPEDYPLEFKLLDIKPEPWTLLKSASILGNFSYTLCFRHNDLASTNMKTILGDSLFQDLFPEYHEKESPIIPSGTPFNFASQEQEETGETLSGIVPFLTPEQPDENLGSNNWAVSPDKTKNGAPILCSDPHLNLTLPSIWFEVHINTPELNAYGVTTPGLPGILIGFNENIAYGVTNVGADVLDWYNIKWTNEEKTKYMYDGEEKEVDFRMEKIKIKGQAETVIDTVKYTVWGPVVYEDAGNDYDGMAMHWIVHDDPGKKPFYGLGAFLNLMESKNFEDYKTSLSGFDLPAQNFVFAAKDGDIALRVNGKLPIKSEQQGRFIQDGSSSSNGWKGFIPREEIPAVKNPPRGFVSSANQKSTDTLYPYYYNGQNAHYRGRIINRKLAEMNDITIEDMKKLQGLNYSVFPEEALPLLLAQLEGEDISEEEKGLVSKLKNWNYTYEANLEAPVIFEEWFSKFREYTYDEIFEFRDSLDILLPARQYLVLLLEKDINHPVFDLQKTTEIKETAQEIVLKAFHEAAEAIKERSEPTKKWAAYRNTRIRHLGNIPGLSSDLINNGGHRYAINAIQTTAGPSWRMAIELGPESVGFGVYPGGQSGNPGSPYYDNFINTWANGEHYSLQLAKQPDALKNTLFTLNLK